MKFSLLTDSRNYTQNIINNNCTTTWNQTNNSTETEIAEA